MVPSSPQQTALTQSEQSNGGHWSAAVTRSLANISRPAYALGTAVLLFVLLVLIVFLPHTFSRTLPIFIAIGSVVVLLGIALASFWSDTEGPPQQPSILAVSAYLALLLLMTALIAVLVLGDLDPFR